MSGYKFFNRKVYIVPGNNHRFGTETDARLWASEHGKDPSTVEKFDSKKEYLRWLELQLLQREGKINGLRRQVEYEIIPAHVERTYVKDRIVNDWIVENVHFATQKAAWAYCRAAGLQLSAAFRQRISEPVFKDVVIESKAVYTADFVYYDEDGNEVVEDTKSEITRREADYVLRRKLMLHVHGIRIKET